MVSRPAEVVEKERQGQILKLRKVGMTFAEIAEEMGMTASQCRTLYQKAMEDLQVDIEEDALEVRRISIQRLNDMINSLYQRALDGDLMAVDRILKTTEILAGLTGAKIDRVDLTTKGKEIQQIGPEMLQAAQKKAREELDADSA